MICLILLHVLEELFTAKTSYEASNEQLLEELPILLDAAMNILVKRITWFVNATENYSVEEFLSSN